MVSRRPEQTTQPRVPVRGVPHLLDEAPEVLVGDDERVRVRRAGMDEPVADLDVRPLGLIGAEQVVPDQEDAAEVLVDVFGLLA